MDYRIRTAKGGTSGTLEEIAAWQAEHQGSCATLVLTDEATLPGGPLEVEVYDVDFDADDLAATVRRVERVIARALTP